MSGSISPWPVVKSGSTEHPVKTLQYLLRARGHSVAVDGVFGPNTEAAVKAFQTSRGLVADGIVGPLTWAALVVQVKKGSQGDAVRGVQEEFQFRNLFSASPFARHSFRKGRRNRWSGYLAGPGEWHAFFLAAA
jgi:lysozyme family protein